MATLAELVVKISGDTASLSAALGRAEKLMGGLQGAAGKVGSAFGGMAKIAGGFVMAQGIMSAPGILMSAAQAAADEEASLARLQKAVENTGAVWSTYGGQLDAVVEAGMKRGFDDDAQRASLSLLMAQTGNADEAMRRFALSQDVARGAGIDLEMASRLLGKVTEENANVFKRMGINLEAGASEAEAFAALQQKFGGQAEAYAKSSAGQFEVAKIQMGELKEDIGAVLLPALVKLAGTFTEKVIPALRELAAEWIPKIKQAFADFASSSVFATAQVGIMTIYEAGKALVDFISNNKVAMIATLTAIGVAIAIAIGPASLAIAAIAGIILAVGYLRQHWDDIQAKTLEVWNGISDFLNEKFGFLKGIFETAFTYYYNIAMFVFAEIKNYIETTINIIRDIIVVVMALLKGDWSGAWEGMKQLVTDVWEGIKGAIMPAIDLIRNQLQLLWDVTEGLRGFLADKFAPAWTGLSWVFGVVQSILGDLRDAFQWVIDKVFALKDAVEDALGPLGDLIDKAGDLLGKAGDIGGGLKKGLGFASGGVTPYSGLFSVGERGRELVALPGGSRVYSNTESRQMVSESTRIGHQGDTYYGPVTNVIQGGSDEDFGRLLERRFR